MPETTPDDKSLRSEEVNEILSETPRWILRWGITVVFIVILTGIALSWFIRYPDVITTGISITAVNPPVTLVAKKNGKLSHLLIRNGQHVHGGQLLGIIANSAEFTDVIALSEAVQKIKHTVLQVDTLPFLGLSDQLHVGQITVPYLQLLKSVKDVNLLLQRKSYEKEISALRSALEHLRQLASNAGRKNAAVDLQVTVAEKNIIQLQIQHSEEQNKLRNDLLQDLESVLSEIQQWKQLYLLESPVDGTVSCADSLYINQNVVPGEQLFLITPREKQQYIGLCTLLIANGGKPAAGHKVNIKLDNYPYTANGMLTGVVKNSTVLPGNDTCLVAVELPAGLTTSYHKILVYDGLLKGRADIITANRSIMERVLFNLRK